MADVGGIMTGLANMANSIVQPISQKRQQKRNQEYAKENAKLESELQLNNNLKTMEQQQAYNVKNYEQQRDDAYAREDYLLANQKKLEVQALRNAGLNPSLAGGTSGYQAGASVGSSSIDAPSGGADGIGVSSPSYGSPFTGVDIGQAMESSMKAMEELKILKEEARKRKEEADALEMQNQGTREENDWSSFSLIDHLEQDADGYFYTKDENGNRKRLIDLGKNAPTTKAGVLAMNTFHKMLADSAHYLSSENRNFLDAMVSGLQISDDRVLESLKNMPNELIRELRSKNSLTELETEIKGAEKYFWKKAESMDNDVVKFLASAFLTFRK